MEPEAAGAPRVAHSALDVLPQSHSPRPVYDSCQGTAVYLAAIEEHRLIPLYLYAAKNKASTNFCAFLHPKSKS